MSGKLHDLETATLRNAIGDVCYGKAGLAEGTNPATIQTANAIDYAIDGVLYTKAATDNIALTAATAQADGTTCMYLIEINSSGTVSSVKGTEVTTGNSVYLPDPTEGLCVIGAIKVATSGAAFTAGTTDLGAGTVTDTYYDLSMHTAADFS